MLSTIIFFLLALGVSSNHTPFYCKSANSTVPNSQCGPFPCTLYVTQGVQDTYVCLGSLAVLGQICGAGNIVYDECLPGLTCSFANVTGVCVKSTTTTPSGSVNPVATLGSPVNVANPIVASVSTTMNSASTSSPTNSTSSSIGLLPIGGLAALLTIMSLF